MTIQRMIELLEIEQECMLRGAHDDCDRDCANCELVQDDGDLHEMYTDVIALLKEQEPKLVRIEEDSVHCPTCGNELFTYPRQKFCDECGQAVKWDD